MKKRMFFGFSLFAMLFTLVAWQYAAQELVELQKKPVVEEHKEVQTIFSE